jgi:hypothetical protein
MNTLNINLREPRAHFRPGEWAEGTVSWNFDRDVENAELRLLWFTRGKGDSDVSVVDTQVFAHPGRMESRPFRVQMPNAPHSFSGKLISLLWALELVADGVDEVARLEFSLSASGEEIVLPQVEQDKISQWRNRQPQSSFSSTR